MAYICLVQGWTKKDTLFFSFVKHYSEACLAANVRISWMILQAEIKILIEDNCSAKIFGCLRQLAPKLSEQKKEFGRRNNDYFGETFISKGKCNKWKMSLKVSAAQHWQTNKTPSFPRRSFLYFPGPSQSITI